MTSCLPIGIETVGYLCNNVVFRHLLDVANNNKKLKLCHSGRCMLNSCSLTFSVCSAEWVRPTGDVTRGLAQVTHSELKWHSPCSWIWTQQMYLLILILESKGSVTSISVQGVQSLSISSLSLKTPSWWARPTHCLERRHPGTQASTARSQAHSGSSVKTRLQSYNWSVLCNITSKIHWK